MDLKRFEAREVYEGRFDGTVCGCAFLLVLGVEAEEGVEVVVMGV